MVRRALAAAVVGAALLATACSNGGDTEEPMDAGGPTSSLTAPAPPALPAPYTDVDQTNPESVMVAAAQALFSYTPAADRNQLDAVNRAAPLLDERYYNDNAQSLIALAPITGRQWEQWREEKAVVTATATVTSDEHPEDKPAKVSRVVAVQVNATDPSGRTVDSISFAAYMTATKLGVWRVSGVMVR
ncbi:hypothetical protein GS504_03265 [Rhodococcus hoagii]|nr:hypothetical protein [Prescottella equi]